MENYKPVSLLYEPTMVRVLQDRFAAYVVCHLLCIIYQTVFYLGPQIDLLQ